MYKAVFKPTSVICGEGDIVIVSGWTPCKTIEKRLGSAGLSKAVGCIGQLYSSRGLNFLVRNLLVNPQINQIIALSGTQFDRNSGSVKCLSDLWTNGFEVGTDDAGKPCWKVRSDIPGFIDREVDGDCIAALLREVGFCTVNSIEGLINAVSDRQKGFADRRDGCESRGRVTRSTREAIEFPFTQEMPDTVPSRVYGGIVDGNTIAECWVKVLHRVMRNGVITPTCDGYRKELIDLMTVISNEPRDCVFPEPNYLPIDRDSLESYAPYILSDKHPGDVSYTYGSRLRSYFGKDQVEQIITKLEENKDSTSAVMSLWHVDDHECGMPPCLNHVWVRVQNNALSLTATLRSNDIFSAWTSNAMALRLLQQRIFDRLLLAYPELTMAPLIILSQSAHVYCDCWGAAKEIVKRYYRCRRTYDDPVGNFLVEVGDFPSTKVRSIRVEQTTSIGTPVDSWMGVCAAQLTTLIIEANPTIQPNHAAYLGIELAKAEQSLANSIPYVQDKKLTQK